MNTGGTRLPWRTGTGKSVVAVNLRNLSALIASEAGELRRLARMAGEDAPGNFPNPPRVPPPEITVGRPMCRREPHLEEGNMSPTTQLHPNGVDVEQLVQTIGAIQQDPELARFQFRAASCWITGGRSETAVQGFFGAGQEDASRAEPFVLVGDEPPVLLGSNAGPNAVEVVLHALTSCLTVGLIYNAAARGITVRSLAFELEGDLDLHGFLGLSDSVRPGYESIQLRCRIESDATDEALADLWAHVQRTSPLLDILRNPVPVTVELAA